MATFRWGLLLAVSVALLLSGCQGAAPATPTATTSAPKPTVASAPSPAASPPAAAPASPVASPAASPVAVSSPVASPAASPSPAALASPSPAAAAASPSPVAQGPCSFVLGFATLRDKIGTDVVGDCQENQREVPGNDTAEQRTAKGMMVYRQKDGSMSFTDGTRTWIDGPRGLVDRPANQRFEWEADRQAIEAIQRGGYYVFFRHGTTNRNEQDSNPPNLADCSAQRNLTDEGRAQARAIGEAVRALNVPVGLVLSSPYCRAQEYSKLAFNQAQTEPSLELPDFLPADARQRNTEAMLKILATAPPPNTNVVMVAHSPNIRDAVDVDLPVEGGAVILKPNAGGKPTVVLKVLPNEWGTLAQALGHQ